MDDSSISGVAIMICRFMIHVSIHKMMGAVAHQVMHGSDKDLMETETTSNSMDYPYLYSVAGFQFVMIEAILKFSKDPKWIKEIENWISLKTIHLTLAGFGGIFSLSAAILIMLNLEAIIHTVEYVYYVLPVLLSILSLFNIGLISFNSRLMNELDSSAIRKVNTICGIGSLVMGIVMIFLGKYSQRSEGYANVPIIFLTFALYYIFHTVFHIIIPRPERSHAE